MYVAVMANTYCHRVCVYHFQWSVFLEYMKLVARDVRVAVGASLKCNRHSVFYLTSCMRARACVCVCRDIHSIKSTYMLLSSKLVPADDLLHSLVHRFLTLSCCL